MTSDIRDRSDPRSPASSQVIGRFLFSAFLVGLVLSPSPLLIEGRLLLGVGSSALACWMLTMRGVVHARLATNTGGLILLAYLVAIAAGDSPRISVEAAIPVFVALGVYVFAASNVVSLPTVARAVALGATAISATALCLWVGRMMRWMAAIAAADPSASWAERLPVTLIRAGTFSLHPNGLAMVLEVGLPMLVLLALTTSRYRWCWWTATATSGLTLILTGSRGGWLGGIAGIGAGLTAHSWQRGSWRRIPRWLLVVAVLGVAAAVGLMASGVRPTWLFRATLADRAPAMGAGLDMFGADWVTGRGPGTYMLLFDRYLGDSVYSGVNRVVWNHAHNGYVQSALELGLVGLVLIVVAAGWFARRTFRAAEVDANRGAGVQVAALAGASAALAVHSLVDVVTVWVGPLVLIAALAGIVARDKLSVIPRSHTALRSVLAIIAPLVLLAALPGHLRYQQGLGEASTENWAAAAASFDAAAGLDPVPAYGLASSTAALEGGLIDTESDLEMLTARAARVPTDAVAQLNVGVAAMRMGSTRAAELIDRMSPIIVGDEVAIFQLGWMFEQTGRTEEAGDSYLRALRINPWLADSAVWELLPSGMERRDDFLRQLAVEDGCRMIEPIVLLEIPGIDVDTSECPEASLASLYVYVDRRDWVELSTRVSERIATVPDGPGLRRLEGLAAYERGDVEAARRAWAIGALLNDGYSAMRLVESFTSEEVPAEVLAVAASIAEIRAPVRVIPGSFPVYVLGASRFQVTYQRATPPSPLVRDIWVDLSISQDRRLIDAVLAGYAALISADP